MASIAPAQPWPDEIQKLLDREAIMRLVARYLRGIDRLDRELVRSTFHPDARDDHGGFVSGGRDAFIDAVFDHLGNEWSFTLHTITHSLIEVEGNRAIGEHYHRGYHGLDAGADRAKILRLFGPDYVHEREADGKLGKPHYWDCGGRYVDCYEKRNGEWGFIHRTVRMEWGIYGVADDWSQGIAGTQARDSVPRDRTDRAYTVQEWLKNGKIPA